MYQTIILLAAKQDIKENAKWYEQKQVGLGKRFIEEVRNKISYIKINPMAVTIRYNEIRCVVLEIFPFMIHFNIAEAQKLVIITAVFHISMSIDSWSKRL